MPNRKPNGGVEVPRTPAALITSRGMGSDLAGTWLPMLVSVFWPKLFHWMPSARPAWRVASMKRTSSITCWGASTCTALMISGANWRATTTALSRVAASCAEPESMMRPLADDTWMPLPVIRRSSTASRVMS